MMAGASQAAHSARDFQTKQAVHDGRPPDVLAVPMIVQLLAETEIIDDIPETLNA
jgi:hypothetical protein